MSTHRVVHPLTGPSVERIAAHVLLLGEQLRRAFAGDPALFWAGGHGPRNASWSDLSEKSKFQPQQPGQGAPIQCAPAHLNGRVHGGDVGAVMPIVGISLRQKTSRLWLPLFSFRAPSSLISAQLASLCAKRGVFFLLGAQGSGGGRARAHAATRQAGARCPEFCDGHDRKRAGWSGLFLVSSGGGCARRATPSFVGATSKH